MLINFKIIKKLIKDFEFLIYLSLVASLYSLFVQTLESKPIVLPNHGFRTNILWPIYPGGEFRFFYRGSLHDNQEYRTEGLVGLGFTLPDPRSTEGTFSERAGIIGIRQFISSPWHFEFQIHGGRTRLKNAVSPGLSNLETLGLVLADPQYFLVSELIRKRDYSSNDLKLMGVFGYEWKLGDNWSIDLQAGAAKIVSKSNPWPIYTDSNRTSLAKENIFPVGVVNVTYWF